MRENICIYGHQANSSFWRCHLLKLLGENLRGWHCEICLSAYFQKSTGKIIQICHSSGRVSIGKALAIVHYFQGSASCSFLLQSLPVVWNWQMVRNVPWVKTCPSNVAFPSDDELILRRINAIRNIWYDSWLQNLFVLLWLQKLLLFGVDMPLKIQDALVNVFVVLNFM